MNLLSRPTRIKFGIESCILKIHLQNFRLTDIRAIYSKEDQFIKIRVAFQISYLGNEVGEPLICNSLPSCSKSFVKKKSMQKLFARTTLNIMETCPTPEVAMMIFFLW